ncbi:MAG: GDP-mannose 4,6-dehydratase [Spirochaetota bacterium]
MTILVTGGAGFIGSHTVRALLARGERVVCIDNFNDYYDVRIKEANTASFAGNASFSLHRADICDREFMTALFKQYKFDAVCHLAARAGVRPSIADPFIYQRTNIEGTLTLLDRARQYDVKNFVFASSSSVYGNSQKIPFSETDNVDKPISPYAATKRATEIIAYTYHHLYGLPITALRFFTVYGPSGRPDMAPYLFTDAIANGRTITRFGDGTSKRDYTYVDDIVQGILAAIDTALPYEIMNLGNNSPVALNDFIATIERHLGKKAVIQEKPVQPGDVDITYADISKAQKLLGYRPTTSIDEGLGRFIDWYKGASRNSLSRTK